MVEDVGKNNVRDMGYLNAFTAAASTPLSAGGQDQGS
jgi:hypothetical protein